MNENHRAKVPKQVVRISWLNGEAAGCQDQVALDMATFLAIQTKKRKVIRAVKGVIIGQLLISIVGFGALFELYSANFLMKHFWAVLLVLFALAFLIAEFLAYLERRVAYYAARRTV